MRIAQRKKSQLVALAMLIILSLSCATYNRPYARRMIADSFHEATTMDMGAVPGIPCYSYVAPWELDWVDADGHGWYDLHAVALEFITITPSLLVTWGFVYPVHLLESSLRSDDECPVTGWLYVPTLFLISTPCLLLAVGEDILIHDIPLTLYYAPALLIPGD